MHVRDLVPEGAESVLKKGAALDPEPRPADAFPSKSRGTACCHKHHNIDVKEWDGTAGMNTEEGA
jgi:hypothetical protein